MLVRFLLWEAADDAGDSSLVRTTKEVFDCDFPILFCLLNHELFSGDVSFVKSIASDCTSAQSLSDGDTVASMVALIRFVNHYDVNISVLNDIQWT